MSHRKFELDLNDRFFIGGSHNRKATTIFCIDYICGKSINFIRLKLFMAHCIQDEISHTFT